MDNKLKDTTYYLLTKLSENRPQYQGKKKLAKLLYFTDFYSFKENNKVIATDHYVAWDMGPFPKDLNQVLIMLEEEGYIKKKIVQMRNKKGQTYPYETYEILKQKDLTLDSTEIEQIDKIFNKFKLKNGKYLEDLSHSQAPWNAVDRNEDIPIETAHFLPAFSDI